MKTRFLLAIALLAGLLTPARAGFDFTWGGSGTSVASNASYDVTVNCFFAPSNYWDSQGMVGLYKNGSQVGAASLPAYSWGSSSGTFSDTGPQTITFSADAFSYGGESGYSSCSVTINAQSISTSFSLGDSSFTYDGSTKSVSVGPNPGDATFSYWGTSSAVNAGSYWVGAVASGTYTGSADMYWTISQAGQAIGISPGSATISQGESVTFNASGGGGGGNYIWGDDASGSGSGNTATFNTPGTRYVSVYRQGDDNYQQSNTATAVITVNGYQSSVGISPSSSTITVGESVTFNASGGDGGGDYVWDGAAAGGGGSTTIAFNTTGTHSVTVYRAASSGYNQSNTASATITVQNAGQGTVSVSPSSQSVTVGQAITFTASGGSGGGAYTWGGDASGTGTTKSVTFNTAGARSVTVYRAASSGYNQSNTATATITVNANQGAVSVSPTSGTVGINQSLTFTASGGAGTGAYTWGGDASGTGATKSVTFGTAGARTVTVYRAAAAGYNQSGTVSASITVDGIPPGSPQNVQASNITTTAFTVSWTAPSGEVVTGYRIREPSVSSSWIPVSTGLSYQFGGMGANSQHSVEVQASDAAGNWSSSSPLTVTTGGATGGPGVAGNTFWADVNGDGILDKVTGSNADIFRFNFGSWYTTAPAMSLNLNSYFSAWAGNYGENTLNAFFLRWAPPVELWASGEWLVNMDFTIVSDADRPLKIYKDPSGLPTIDPTRWEPVLNLPGFSTAGTHYVTYVLTHMTAGAFANKQMFLVEAGQPVGSIEISSSSGAALGTANTIGGGATITLPSGSNMRIAAKDLIGRVMNAANNKVVFSVKDVLGQVVSLPNNGVLDILDIGISVSGTWQIGVKIGDSQTIWFSINVQGPPPPPKVLLLLHGMNSRTNTWDTFVSSAFAGSSGEIIDGDFLVGEPVPTSNANGVYCYRLQFGHNESVSVRQGLENITAASIFGYLSDVHTRCGDFQTFSELGDQVKEAIDKILTRHPYAQVLLAGHSRGGLSARAFLQQSPPIGYPSVSEVPAKRAVVGLLTTSSPHLGSSMGRIYNWLDTHPNVPANEDDWEVVELLKSKDFDVRRPVIGDVADNSYEFQWMNSSGSLQNFPTNIRCAEIVYKKVDLGLLALGSWGTNYSVFSGGSGILAGVVTDQLSTAAQTFLLGAGHVPADYPGDGLIRGENQVFTQLTGFGGTANVVPRYIVENQDVVHTDAPGRVTDLMFRLRALAPGWFP